MVAITGNEESGEESAKDERHQYTRNQQSVVNAVVGLICLGISPHSCREREREREQDKCTAKTQRGAGEVNFQQRTRVLIKFSLRLKLLTALKSFKIVLT